MSLVSGILTLAPNWSNVFSRWEGLKRFQKEMIVEDLSHPLKNPVSEAWKWQADYWNREHKNFCPECSWFSWSYNYVVTGDMNIDREIVSLKGRQFVNHWEQRHNGHSRPSSGPSKLKGRSRKP